ncbi:membrane protein [Paracoccus aminophilus JCM 7686]|uniref:Membrane protein n=2 Tax=Paracoccus aminophilus TaxID=34003 RepID=S5Y7V2_PARAH|nr:membrane protein [Paracoccus aminophilus JCM 7686]
MPEDETPQKPCSVCHRDYPARLLTPDSDIRNSLTALIRKDVPDWNEDSAVCADCLLKYRQLYLTHVLADETGELGELESEVAEALRTGRLLTLQTAPEDIEEEQTVGQNVADVVAEWGGSWTFILLFCGVLVLWMGMNAIGILSQPFDPYPFILLNLLLSCVAAFQAPIIMMSQRRQEAKDRLRAENDYQVNLKAELELRLLHDKIDHQLSHQWRRLLEIQRIQIDLLHEMQREAPMSRLGLHHARSEPAAPDQPEAPPETTDPKSL